MGIGKTVFDAAYNAFPDLRCTVKHRAQTWVALTAGIGEGRVDTDMGQAQDLIGNVRFASESVPDNVPFEAGMLLEVKRDSDAKYFPARVTAFQQTAGMIRCDLEAEHPQ
jgi:hypothetical protein